MHDWIARLFEQPDLLKMGHGQRARDLNLGLGWLYYGLARATRPKIVVVIGSFRGFVPLVFGKALADNADGGEVWFIDPSFVDDFWKDPRAVREHFASLGVTNVRHFLMTTQQFVQSPHYQELRDVGIVFIDGYHTQEQARFDYEAFEPRLAPLALAMFHDSVHLQDSGIYGRDKRYQHTVKFYMDELKRREGLQVFDLPFGDGLTLVRKIEPIPPLPPHRDRVAAAMQRSES